MENLPNVILEEIFIWSYHAEKLSWKAINLTSKKWHQIASAVLKKVNIIQAFNLAARTPFTCSGEIPSYQVHVRTDSGKFVFPPSSEDPDINGLVTLCKEASFGRGAQEVLDPDYRSALVLDPSQFATNFHPADFNILNDVRRILAPHWHQVNSKLYRLNIYPPGGFFKVHKDTPRGTNHLGSLVVVLPFPHKGGKLVITHGPREEVLDASWTHANKDSPTIQWSAFFGDCDHWIENVTSGYRVTLTYHLFTSTFLDTTFTPQKDPIYALLADVVANIEMKEDEKYGFILRHEYSTSELNVGGDNPAQVLRGSDAILFSAAIALGLNVFLRAIFYSTTARNYLSPGRDEEEEEFKKEHRKLLIAEMPDPEAILDYCSIETESAGHYVSRQFGAREIKDNEIHWCTEIPLYLRNFAGSAAVSTGNEPSTDGFYYQAVLILSKKGPGKREASEGAGQKSAKRGRNRQNLSFILG